MKSQAPSIIYGLLQITNSGINYWTKNIFYVYTDKIVFIYNLNAQKYG